MPNKSSSDVDIFELLSGKTEKTELRSQSNNQRQELLAATGMREIFSEGKIRVNKHTCVGVQCKLCIKACPTNALYWKTGEVGIIEDLCVYCGACVLSCMVDDCIKVTRKRENGKTERFGKTREVLMIAERYSTGKRFLRVSEVFPSVAEYCIKYPFQI